MPELINIQALLDEAITKRSQARTSARDKDYFHVSDAGTCYRKRYLKRLGVEPTREIAVGALRKMLAGDAGHEMIQNTLKWHGGLFAAEGETQSENLKGHFDGVIKTPNGKLLLEIKTVEKWSMKYIKEDGPKPEHLLQMFTYWDFMRKDYTGLDQASLFYVKREDFEGVPFNYLWSEDIATKVTEEWLPLIQHWRAQTLPPCTCPLDYGGNGIKYCRYIAEDEESCCNESLMTTLTNQKD